MKAKKNPFNLIGFTEEKYFCDRKEETKTLIEHLNNNRNVVIHAWIRLGKTALIHFLRYKLEKSKEWETIYIDLLGKQTKTEVTKSITQAVYEKYGKTQSSTFAQGMFKLLGGLGLSVTFDPQTGVPTLDTNFTPRQELPATLNQIGDFLATRKKKVLLVFDEFQQIAKFQKNESMEALFRSFMQDHPTLRIIFSGSERNLLNSMFLDPTRPFYKSCSLLGLEPIALNHYTNFITAHFKDDKQAIAPEVIEEIYQWSRGQTYSIQVLCNHLYASNGNNGLEHLETIKSKIILEQAPLFANIGNLLTSKQWQVIKAIAKEEPLENPQSSDFIKKHDLKAASSVRTALNTLLSKEIVLRDGKEYLVHDVQFARWLQSL